MRRTPICTHHYLLLILFSDKLITKFLVKVVKYYFMGCFFFFTFFNTLVINILDIPDSFSWLHVRCDYFLFVTNRTIFMFQYIEIPTRILRESKFFITNLIKFTRITLRVIYYSLQSKFIYNTYQYVQCFAFSEKT